MRAAAATLPAAILAACTQTADLPPAASPVPVAADGAGAVAMFERLCLDVLPAFEGAPDGFRAAGLDGPVKKVAEGEVYEGPGASGWLGFDAAGGYGECAQEYRLSAEEADVALALAPVRFAARTDGPAWQTDALANLYPSIVVWEERGSCALARIPANGLEEGRLTLEVVVAPAAGPCLEVWADRYFRRERIAAFSEV